MKLAVIFDSRTGNTRKAAGWIADGMSSVPGVECRLFHINEVDEAFVQAAKGVVLGSPSYGASMTADMRVWLQDSAKKMGLGGKLGGAFATEQYTHGGAELVIQSLLICELTAGMLCYSGGSALGKPVIHIGPVGVNGNVELHNRLGVYQEYFQIFGRRFAIKALELFGE